jgi:hypothetical protein
MSQELPKKQFVALPLPNAPADWVRKTDFHQTNNDRVERIHIALINNHKLSEKYKDHLRAVTDAEAIEGSLALDNGDAARMIRDMAHEMNEHIIARLKLKAIIIHLNVVLKRYGMSRSERRQLIDGQIIASGNGDSDSSN